MVRVFFDPQEFVSLPNNFRLRSPRNKQTRFPKTHSSGAIVSFKNKPGSWKMTFPSTPGTKRCNSVLFHFGWIWSQNQNLDVFLWVFCKKKTCQICCFFLAHQKHIKNFPRPKKEAKMLRLHPGLPALTKHPTPSLFGGRCREAGGRHPSAPGGGRPVLDTSRWGTSRRRRMVSSGKKVAHFFRGYAVTPFITIGTHLVLEGFGIVWILRETQHGVFFVPNH